MNTYEEQKAFFDGHWGAIRGALEADGPAGAVAYIETLEDPRQQRLLHAFVRQGVVMGEWEGKNLDAAVHLARAGIRAILDAAEATDVDEMRAGLTNMANAVSYNLAADLADCWPGDELPRTPAHFEAGLEAAKDCVRWREELGNPPQTLSMAWWARGMHELSLGRAVDAATSWEKSLGFARAASDDERSFSIVLGQGYLGLARWAEGDDGGRAMYEGAITEFRSQLEDAERKDEASFGIDQLETVKARYGPK